MAKRTRIEVTHSKRDGVWRVKGGGADATFDTKAKAVRAATDAGRGLGNASVVIHKMDGKIDEERTYGESAGTGSGSTAARATSQRGRSADALAMLKDDHARVKSMLQDIESSTEGAGESRVTMLATLRRDLEAHETIEEEILYAALRDHAKTKELALEAYEEHHVVDLVMADIEKVSLSDDRWAAKFAVLKENLEHHIEEEEGQMFKQAQQVFSNQDLEELAELMRIRRDELMSAVG